MNLVNYSWFEKYRAKDLNEYIFPNDEIRDFAYQVKETGMFPGNTLFYGKPGTGKTNLAQILIKHVIGNLKSPDLFVIKQRSVSEIDEIKRWITKKPLKKQKIVFAEEADRLVHNQSGALIAELKAITEKYLPRTVFVFITNYFSKFKSADEALLTRFTYTFYFDKLPKDKVFEKLKFILENENIEYDENDLWKFIEIYENDGLREMINKLQRFSRTGKFILRSNNTEVKKDLTVEERLIEYTLMFSNQLLKLQPQQLISLLLKSNIIQNEYINESYIQIVTIVQGDPMIDYEYVINRLIDKIDFLPYIRILVKYLEELPYKKYKQLHYLSMITEFIKCVVEIKTHYVPS